MEYKHYSKVFWDQVARYGDRVALRHKPSDTWEEISWNALGEQVKSIASALVDAGIGEQ